MPHIKKAILGLGLLVVLVAGTQSVFADESKKDDKPAASVKDDKAPGSGPNPWADCGIGAALFSDTKWAAVISNVIWDIGITAVISATASPQTCSGKHVAAANFINQTYANLAEETAAGKGEHLSAVLNLLECRVDRHPEAIAQVRRATAALVSAPSYVDQSHVQKASAYYTAVESAVAANCAS